MTNKELDRLLAKYWNAESTLEEETQLRSYFSSNTFDYQYSEVALLFHVFSSDRQINAPVLKVPELEPFKSRANTKVVQFGTNWRAAAAILVIAIAALFLVKSGLDNTTQMKATYVEVDDPESALEFTRMALAMLSKNYQKGSAEITNNINSLNKMDIIK
jgi:hypothetical protein